MLLLVWDAEQLESAPPEILEEFTDYEVVHNLVDSAVYLTKYQIWEEVAKLLMHPSLAKKREVIEYLKLKLERL
jgi:hypothetical protein